MSANTPTDSERFPLVKKNEHFNVLDLVNSSELPGAAEGNTPDLSENRLAVGNNKYEEDKVILDGVMCLGRTWNIVEAAGNTEIYDELTVAERPALYYNGIAEATEPPYRYEIEFADFEMGTLSLLITSTTDKCLSNTGELVPLNHSTMCRVFRDVIITAIFTADDNSCSHIRKQKPKLIVYESDWELIGNLLTYELKENTFEGIFPTDAKFHFLFKQFGQNQTIEPTERINHYPKLRMQHVDRLSMHLAVDFEPDDNNKILFFNSKFAEPLQCRPTYKYNPCLVPETGEYVYTNLPPNGFNVLAVRQYTRLFQAIHRNKNGFFQKPFIAETMLVAYLNHLNGRGLDSNNITKNKKALGAILGPALLELHEAIQQVLTSSFSSAPVKSRFECVWSSDLSVEKDSSFLHYQSQAVNDCIQFMNTCQCVNNRHLFTTYPRDVICKYLAYQLNTFFNTILSAVVSLKEVLQKEPANIAQAATTLTLEDFSAIFLSEAMISRLTTGSFHTSLPNFVCELVMQELDTERCILKWPFDEQRMREHLDFLTVTDISVTNCFPNLDLPNLIIGAQPDMDILLEKHRIWMALPINPPQSTLVRVCFDFFTDILHQLLQMLLKHNGMAANNDMALRKLWNAGGLSSNQVAEIHSSISLYEWLMGLSEHSFSEMQILVLMMELVSMQTTERWEGGFRFMISMMMDELMYTAGAPFILRLPSQTIQIVFIPYTLPPTKSLSRIAEIYETAFYTSFGRSLGRAQIPVIIFLSPIVTYMHSLDVDDRPRGMFRLFNIINKLLDSDSYTRSPAFLKLSAAVRSILIAPHVRQAGRIASMRHHARRNDDTRNR